MSYERPVRKQVMVLSELWVLSRLMSLSSVFDEIADDCSESTEAALNENFESKRML